MNAADFQAGAVPTWRSEAFAEDLFDPVDAPKPRGRGWLLGLPLAASLLGSILLLVLPPP